MTDAVKRARGKPVGRASAPDRVQSVVGSVFELPRGWKRKRGETLVDHFARWCELALVHGRDQFAGQSFVLEAWERAFLTDALEEEAGMPVWSSVALIVARKNGKTSLLAAWSLYRLIFGVGQPEILLAAASDRQAGRLFEAVVGYIRRNPLLVKLVHLREYIGEVSRVDGGGKILRMASDPSTLFGYDPSDVVIDELHAWTKPSLRQAWTALTTGGGGRKTTRVFSISTAGDAQARADSILGRLLDGNEQHGELEHRPGLTISRNPGARTLVWSYSAPTLDPHNVEAMKLANPASWITVDYLRRQAENPELSDADVLQLHGCVWAVGESSWLDPAAWAARKAVRGLEEDETIVLGFDGSYRRDATALVACTLDGHLVPLAIWERPERAPDDWKIPRAEVDAVLAEAMERYQVVELAADPPGWHAEIDGWRDTYGEIVLEFSTNQRQRMAAACDGFRAGVLEDGLTHNGDAALARHVGNCRTKETPSGMVVVKSGEERKIDAAVAAVIAYDRAAWHAHNPPFADWGPV